jgi:hypothetical protein
MSMSVARGASIRRGELWEWNVVFKPVGSEGVADTSAGDVAYSIDGAREMDRRTMHQCRAVPSWGVCRL